MIVAVCLNPALDVTYSVAALQPGTSHRVQTARRRPGGKGVNVAAVLTQQHVPALVTGPVGGSVGKELAAGLDAAGIAHQFSPIAASTRQTVTVVSDDDATVLNEPGPELTEAEWSAFTAQFADLMRRADLVTMSGSLPLGVRPSAYAELIDIAHQHETVVLLDCEGESLTEALHARPDIVKINEHEAASTTGVETSSTDGVFAAAEKLRTLGAAEVVITRGTAGMAARTRAGRFVGRSARTVSGNPTGAGDAFAAGLAAATVASAPWPDRLRRAGAWAAGAVAMPVAGEIDPATVREHQSSTIIEEFEE